MKQKMLCLGIESTAHTIACAIVDKNCKILGDQRKTFTTISGGLKPSQVADHHYVNAVQIVKNTLKEASLQMKDIDCIAFSQGPGLGPCLRIGAVTARTLALANNKPLIGVNHALAHIEIAKKLTKAIDPVIVYVSGGNSQILVFDKQKYRVLGETIDIGVGNLLDSFGRSLGLGFPAGPKIDQMYFQAKKYEKLPYSVKGMDLHFSGLLSAAEKKINKTNQSDLAFSLMHTAFAIIAEVTERALAFTQKKQALVTGGVACSKALQEMLEKMCKQRKISLHVCPAKYAVDNAAMIAWTGMLHFKHGQKTSIKNSQTIQRFRADKIKIKWKSKE